MPVVEVVVSSSCLMSSYVHGDTYVGLIIDFIYCENQRKTSQAFTGQTSRPHSKIGKHFVFNYSTRLRVMRMKKSATVPILPKITGCAVAPALC